MNVNKPTIIKYKAATIVEYASALMWESKHEAFLTQQLHENFIELAAALGYRVEKIKADEVAG